MKYAASRKAAFAAFAWFFLSTFWAMALVPRPAAAHRPSATPDQPTLGEILAGDAEVKRLPNSGLGMPSIMGPFPDTLNMAWLGQIVNRDLGASRLIQTGATFLSDIWGWTSPAGQEYAIVGHNSGVADGRCAAADARYFGNGFVRAHNISINEDTGRAYLTGVTKNTDIDAGFVDEGMLILDLNGDPLVPVEAGQVLGRDTHDAQIVTYDGPDSDYTGKEIAFVFNGEDLTVGIYDVTDIDGGEAVDVRDGGPVVISETTYAGAGFTHQGWLTGDHAFLLVGDEEDELFGLQDPRNPDLPDTARTRVMNVQDLEHPSVVSFFDSPAASIDHNLFVHTDTASGREFVYQAHYTAGIRVTELKRDGDAGPTQVAWLREVAHMDTEPRLPNHNLNFNFNIWEGPWGVYPFLNSGTIMASDGLNGLVLMKLELP